MSTRPIRFAASLARRGRAVTWRRMTSGDLCKCVQKAHNPAATGGYDPDWHEANPGEDDCGNTTYINKVYSNDADTILLLTLAVSAGMPFGFIIPEQVEEGLRQPNAHLVVGPADGPMASLTRQADRLYLGAVQVGVRKFRMLSDAHAMTVDGATYCYLAAMQETEPDA